MQSCYVSRMTWEREKKTYNTESSVHNFLLLNFVPLACCRTDSAQYTVKLL